MPAPLWRQLSVKHVSPNSAKAENEAEQPSGCPPDVHQLVRVLTARISSSILGSMIVRVDSSVVAYSMGLVIERSLVRVAGTAREFSPRISFQCRLSYGVSTAPRVQSHASTSVRTLQIPNTGSHSLPLFGHTKILQTLIGMGSAALAAALPYLGKATRISRKEY